MIRLATDETDTYLSPILFTAGDYKIERLARVTPEGGTTADEPAFALTSFGEVLDFAPPSVGKIGTEFGL